MNSFPSPRPPTTFSGLLQSFRDKGYKWTSIWFALGFVALALIILAALGYAFLGLLIMGLGAVLHAADVLPSGLSYVHSVIIGVIVWTIVRVLGR